MLSQPCGARADSPAAGPPPWLPRAPASKALENRATAACILPGAQALLLGPTRFLTSRQAGLASQGTDDTRDVALGPCKAPGLGLERGVCAPMAASSLGAWAWPEEAQPRRAGADPKGRGPPALGGWG